MTVNVGIVGVGWAGQQHAKVLASLPDAAVVAGADPDQVRLEAFAKNHGARAYASADEMLTAESDLNAVIVAAEAAVRLEPIRSICDRRLAVFCEKPPALDLATAREVKGIIEQSGVINSVGFQSRWSRAAARMRELIAGRLPLFAQITVAWRVFDWVKDGSWSRRLYTKSGCGGPMIEQGIHYQDALRYMTGDEPVRVHAMAELGKTEPIEGRDCEETTVVLAQHAAGMLSTHVQNWSCSRTLHRIQVVGDAFDLTWLLSEGDKVVGRIDGSEINETLDADPYVEEIRGFVAAVARNDQTIIRSDYADACKTLAVCQAAARAVETGLPQDVERI